MGLRRFAQFENDSRRRRAARIGDLERALRTPAVSGTTASRCNCILHAHDKSNRGGAQHVIECAPQLHARLCTAALKRGALGCAAFVHAAATVVTNDVSVVFDQSFVGHRVAPAEARAAVGTTSINIAALLFGADNFRVVWPQALVGPLFVGPGSLCWSLCSFCWPWVPLLLGLFLGVLSLAYVM